MIAATPSSTDCRREPQNARATTLPTDNIINGNGLIQLLGPESATISGARTLDETQPSGRTGASGSAAWWAAAWWAAAWWWAARWSAARWWAGCCGAPAYTPPSRSDATRALGTDPLVARMPGRTAACLAGLGS